MNALPQPPADSDPGDEQPRAEIIPFPKATIPQELAREQEEDLTELDELLPAAFDPTDLSDLDALMVESVGLQLETDLAAAATKAEARGVADARKRLVQDPGGLTVTEREELRRRIFEWETQHEWLSQQLVYAEEVDLCACGTAHSHFLGLYQIQNSRAKAGLRRIVMMPEGAGDSTLTRTFHRIGRAVPFCPTCRELSGFALAYDGELWAQEGLKEKMEAAQGQQEIKT